MQTKKVHVISLIARLAIALMGCHQSSKLVPGEGYVAVTGGKIWYRIVGTGEATPLLLLHGGPGMPSYYLEPLTALANERPVILFDQLGCGRSDRNQDTTLMTVEAYVEQLEQFRIALGIEKFYLYGHSWGTMLGVDYYLKYPDAIQAMILSSPALSTSRWEQDAAVGIASLTDSMQAAIAASVSAGDFQSPGYQQAVWAYYEQFLARKLPWDRSIDSTFAGMNATLYEFMWGPSEFTATGNLKGYDRTNVLNEIKIPTLFICGEFDEARPETVRYYQSLVQNSKFVVNAGAAHLTMHDNPTSDIQAIRNFLLDQENSGR